ncbi:MAG: hypothetical protein WCA12_08460 [Burkholderiales bacterium]
MDREYEIYCPHCAWRPAPEDRWLCAPGCGTVWNTFWTRGLCPGCARQWEDTQCLSCRKVSAHRKWYHYPERGSRERKHKTREPTTA